jgi:carbonic anhydrase/acetyltransferase-like protein (isoleucine patch superfamily)
VIISSGTKKPKIHSSAYVAPSAILSGEVTVGAGCAVLHGAVIAAEGAPVTIGDETVVMEHSVVKASGGSTLKHPVTIGKRCIIGPHAYVSGASIEDGCFIASGSRVFNGARMGKGSGVALNAIVHVGTVLAPGASVPMLHIAYGNPAKIVAPEQARQVHEHIDFFADVFNVEPGDGARARAAEVYAKFLRKTHAQDSTLDAHVNKVPQRRSAGEEPPQERPVEAETVVDVMMLELQEMEHRRREAVKKRKPS